MGRDAVDHYGDPESLVSIHAPTWGATLASVLVVVGRAVSIHAPTWGATVLLRWMLQLGYLFQSTRPRGARPLDETQFLCQIVSIHAPTWGAT